MPSGGDQREAGDHTAHRADFEGSALAAAIQTESPIRAPGSFQRIGARWIGDGSADLEIATSADGIEWSRWQSFESHYSELEEVAVQSGDIWSMTGDDQSYYRLRLVSGQVPDKLTLEFFEQTAGDDVESGDMLVPFLARAAGETIRFGAAEVLPRSAWNARPARCSSGHTPRRITLHHTEQANDSQLSAAALIRSVQGYHQNTRGWCDIGYHFLISRDGQIWEGRPIDRIGAHAGHGNNTGNIGIAMLGNFVSAQPTDAQQSAVAALVRGVALERGIPLDRHHFEGHREMRATECPGDAAFALIDELLGLANGDLGDLPQTPRPETVRIVGAVYQDGDLAARIATAEVRVNGELVAVDPFGVYETRVTANSTAVIEVTAPGYEPVRVERQAASDPTWSSVALAAVGSVEGSAGLQGVVYRNREALDRIGHAVIELDNGRTAVATASGYFRIGNLAPGDYTITASATGFAARSITATADSGNYAWASIELQPGDAPEPAGGPSCGPICGTDQPLFDEGRCYCDSLCVKNDDCCASYYSECR
jgi:hypothetical protein